VQSVFVSHLKLRNWRNFTEVDVPLRRRQFIVGPNASGKSNLLDVFRFLRDIANPKGGGLLRALEKRGGVSKIRCLAARQTPTIEIEIELAENEGETPLWRYAIAIAQESRGQHRSYLTFEKVWEKGNLILDRPHSNREDQSDKERMQETHLEHASTNAAFREIAHFFSSITYLHLVPQLMRERDSFQGRLLENDPYGQEFLEKIAKANIGKLNQDKEVQLKKLEQVLRIAVPYLQELKLVRHETRGTPHLEARYKHWRGHGARQREDQFSDGTLRLLGIIWSLLEGKSLLLLEEPELSLNVGVVAQLAPMIHTAQRKKKQQVLISTHSDTLLSDSGIGGEEVLLVSPGKEGSTVKNAKDIQEISSLLEQGFPVGEVLMSKTKPEGVERMGLFE